MSGRVIDAAVNSDPFGSSFDNYSPPAERMPVPVGGAVDRAQAQMVFAQRVPIKRDLGRVKREALEQASALGSDMFYRWEVENKKAGRKDIIEGPSIVCAMIAASCYGNCSVEAFPAQDTETHWVFMARFVDYERGLTLTRSFQQRKAQGFGGKMAADRALDLVFQIGQSKAIRNVVLGALRWLCDEMVEAGKNGILERISRNPDAARAQVVKMAANAGIDEARLQRAAGKPIASWVARDIAFMGARVKSVADGMEEAEVLFPTKDQAEEDEYPPAGDTRTATAVPPPAAPPAAPPADPAPPPAAPRRTRTAAPAAEPAPPPTERSPPPSDEPEWPGPGPGDGAAAPETELKFE